GAPAPPRAAGPAGPGGPTAPGGPGNERPSSPATRAMQLARTKPQPQLANGGGTDTWAGENGNGNGYAGPETTPGATRPDGYAHPAAGGPARPKRRWPIVTGVLVLLVLVIGGGLIAGWQYVRGQYYIGTRAGDVAIFRGVNQDVAGISLSSLVQQSPLPVAQLGADSRAQVSQTISYGSLEKAQSVLASLRQQAAKCQQGYQALASWQAAETRYRQQMAVYNKIPAAQKRGKDKPAAPPAEPAAPASGAMCAPSTAFGIPASALPSGQAGGENPTAAPSATPTATPPATATPSPGKSA
ncbi:MAG: hypothetical protein J2P26_14425, partial [Nocardiopsaceae bacterium]|nr:hypothetical protein [Nocardiopsaceae bacterium]